MKCQAGSPSLTPGYLHLKDGHVVQGLRLGESYGSAKLRLLFLAEDGSEAIPSTTSFVPVELCYSTSTSHLTGQFDCARFFSELSTERLGHALLYIPVCTSTMDIAQCLVHSLPTDQSCVVIAGRQTNGTGRGGNQWLSPTGCAMFSFGLKVSVNSPLGSTPAFVQHILALAVIQAVTSIPGMEEFPLKLKWPNDIYYARAFKLGGVLVNSMMMGDSFHFTLGAGLNVANSKPTVCINDMLDDSKQNKLDVETVIARTLNNFEDLVDCFQNGGREEVQAQYYQCWLHSLEEVTLQQEEQEKVVIRGLDEHGFLLVRSRRTGRTFSVHPDGNSFDMMKNLIRPKI